MTAVETRQVPRSQLVLPWPRRAGRARPRNVQGAVGASLLAIVVGVSLTAPLIAPHDPNELDLTATLTGPSLTSGHLLGTDQLGRDLFSRVLYGGRASLLIVCVAVALAVTFGVGLGLLAGSRGGWVDQVASRGAEIQLALPAVLLALVILSFGGVSNRNIVVVLILAMWPSQFRIARANAMSIRGRPYVEAAGMVGSSKRATLWRHYLPSVLPLAVVTATLSLSSGLIIASSLSFLGLGIQPPTPDWGQMIAGGQTQLGAAWWLAVMPGIALLVTLLGIQMFGDWLSSRLSVQGLIRQEGSQV